MAKANLVSRREFLKTAALGGLAATLPFGARGADPKPNARPAKGTAKNLIFLVADGMSHGTLAAANHYLNLTEDRDSEWLQLYRKGLARRSLMETRSASSVVTDSAAASSSWGCGQRLYNRSINTGEDGQALKPLYSYAREAGLRTGLVSTARITHATPAGFAANVAHRDSENEIASQYLERRIDVLLGGGSRHFDPAKRKDKRDMFLEFEGAGYNVVRDRKTFEALPGRFQPTLGVFSSSHMPFSIDMAHDEAIRSRTPALSGMMVQALRLLSEGGAPFVLQVEGGRVDHGAHENDPAATLFDLLEFDRCIAVARKFAEEKGETLVIITTDHGTGGFMLNGYGQEYSLSTERFLNLGKATQSFEHMLDSLPKAPSADDIAAMLENGLGLKPSASEMAKVVEAFRRKGGEGETEFLDVDVNLGEILRPLLYDFYAVNWTSQNHTAEEAEFAAFGPGSDSIPGWFENWELHQYVRNALGI